MKDFDWEEFKTGDSTVHCNTEEKANDFLKQAHRHGFTWDSGKLLTNKNNWEFHRENTCYRIWSLTGNMTHSIFANSRECCYIIEWEIDEMKEFTKEDLKVGMLVETKCGTKAILMPHENGGLALSYQDIGWDNITFNKCYGTSIVKVWSSRCCLDFSGFGRTLLWEYEKTEEMTLEAVCKELGRNIKIIK